ncbi:DUF7504 family protein [Halogranum rubrum]|uniref:Recombinase RecA n=1 Tax=Halogranum salarium B-1 TaxID=1210908 RepID=J3EYC1_9EURY|nr:hypothetical protein [Halogranum salarium]EJN60307.1 hypothetical protein HSB1_09100 [Halogranum salarium B-1]
MFDDSASVPPALQSGQSVLISGPPMTGKYEVLLRQLTSSADRLIVVSTDTPADQIRRDVADYADLPEEALGIVDCTSKASGKDVSDTDTVRYVSSPENLTQVGVQFTALCEQFQGDDVAVGLHSLSPLLMYWDVDRVYQFLRVFLDRVRSSSWCCAAVVGSTMHDEQVLHTLYDPFDAIIETRESDEGRQLRRRGRREAASEWTTF